MTGPEHFAEGERLAEIAKSYTDQPDTHHVQFGQLAQAHFTAALVMAIADPMGYGGRSDSQRTDVTR